MRIYIEKIWRPAFWSNFLNFQTVFEKKDLHLRTLLGLSPPPPEKSWIRTWFDVQK